MITLIIMIILLFLEITLIFNTLAIRHIAKKYRVPVEFYFKRMCVYKKEAESLKQFYDKVFDSIDNRINTLQANSDQCHQGGNHDKGIEFTLQAELLERLRKELKNNG